MFSEDLTLVNNVSAETKNAITRKSAQTLPNNPSERGYSAEEIKRRFYQPILDTANSSLAEIDRVVDEVNNALGQIDTNMDTFLEQSLIAEPYKVTIEESTWTYNEEDAIYEFFVTADEHGISNIDEIGIDMFLLDGDGYYVSVNQFEISSNGTVHFFSESATAGYLNIYTKREGYVWGDVAVDVNKVVGISKVGISNSYNDLDDLPDLSLMDDNETMISKMISGAQKVTNAVNAENATNATYATTSGAATSASTATTATKASQDEYGVNISANYAKQNGTYADMTVGNATNAVNAENADEATNALAVNNLEITQDDNGVLKIESVIIPQEILLFDDEITSSTSSSATSTIELSESLSAGDLIKVYWGITGSQYKFISFGFIHALSGGLIHLTPAISSTNYSWLYQPFTPVLNMKDSSTMNFSGGYLGMSSSEIGKTQINSSSDAYGKLTVYKIYKIIE